MWSCDHSEPLTIEGEKEYKIRTDCGNISVTANTFGRRIWIYLKLDGDFTLNQDSLKIEFSPSASAIDMELCKILENYDRIKVEDKVIKIKNEKARYSLGFMMQGGDYFVTESTIITLLPSNFITCKNKPLINDTIKIKLRTK
ncbi:MAG: hypothetical protein LBV74_04430 [Tannerella sp.]|jgi:hypothetical protein|nr:hypothetical protein [Tannerella sp.]